MRGLITVLTILICLTAVSVSAQGNTDMLLKYQGFEARLVQLEKRISQYKSYEQQYGELQRKLIWLESELKNVPQSNQSHSDWSANWSQWTTQISRLENEVRQLRSKMYTTKQKQDVMYVDLNTQMGDLHSNTETPHKQKSQETKTKVHFRMYSHGMYDFTDDAQVSSEFAVSRAYLTLKSKLADYASIRITTDLRTIDDKYDIILKYAYLDWKPTFAQGYFKSRLGLQPTQYIDQMNKFWGRRYLAKTVGDAHAFLTSSDLGLSATVGFGKKSKYGFVNMALLNGTSYTHVGELNGQKDFNLVAKVKPFGDVRLFKNSVFMGQFYSGTQNEAIVDTVSSSDWKRQIVSFGGLLAYNSIFDAGFDLNFTTQGVGPGSDAVKKSGLSFFGSFYLKKLVTNSSWFNTLNFFGRYDLYDPNTDNAKDAENMMIVGIEYTPIKGFKTSLNYRSVAHEDTAIESESTFYLNTLVQF